MQQCEHRWNMVVAVNKVGRLVDFSKVVRNRNAGLANFIRDRTQDRAENQRAMAAGQKGPRQVRERRAPNRRDCPARDW